MIDQPDSYDSHDEIKLADGYDDICYLLQELDKRIVHERYAITQDDPAVQARWALAHFIHDYDQGEILTYGDYLALVLQAQTILEGDEND